MYTRLAAPGSVFGSVLAVVFIFNGVEGLLEDAQFAGQVGRAEGIVQKVWTTTNRSHLVTYYHANCRYSTEDGRDEQSDFRVAPDLYPQLPHTGSVPIKYLPQNPEISRIDLPGEDQFIWELHLRDLGIGIVFAVFGLFALWLALPRSKRSWEDAAVQMDMGRKS